MMKIKIKWYSGISLVGALLLLRTATSAAQGQGYYNVLDYGAKRGGNHKVTEAVKKTIDAAYEDGGGTVYFPPGEYLTGPIHLKSNITLRIDAGALIKFSNDFGDYLPMVKSRWQGTNVTNFSPLIYAYKAKNIAIVGRGTIDGQGKKWWSYFYKINSGEVTDTKWQKRFAELNKDVVLPDQPAMIKQGFLRPPFIQPMYCDNVRIEGITIKNSPFWTVNPEYSTNVTVDGVTIKNPESPNTDGINPESCNNVHISNCHISVGDDCITIKSGKDRDGRQQGVPAQNYTITNNTMLSGHGGVVIGSEMSGGVKKITISNCVFDGTDRGIRIKSTRGRGGTVEDLRVSNVIMKNIKEQAFMLNMFYSKKPKEPVSERTPRFKNFHFSNITAEADEAGFLLGLPEMPIGNISFTDVNIKANKGFTIKDAKNIGFHNVQVTTDLGPVIDAEQVSGLNIDGVSTLQPHEDTPVIRLKNVTEAFIHGSFQRVPTELFLKVEGAESNNISVSGNNLVETDNAILKTADVSENAVSSDQ